MNTRAKRTKNVDARARFRARLAEISNGPMTTEAVAKTSEATPIEARSSDLPGDGVTVDLEVPHAGDEGS